MSPPEAAAVVVKGHSTALDASVPVLLLPVRIETRFVDNADNQASLLLRVYPDTISVSSFEPELTNDEIADGQEYWNLVWRTGVPPQPADAPAAAWRGLASRYSPQRAAWIAFSLTPKNIAAQPVVPTPDGSDPNPQPSFPAPVTRASSYEKAPTAALLPDQWFVYLESGVDSRVVQSGPITASLAVGLSPRDGNFPDGLPVDAGMRWLIDFDEAVKVGMGVRIPLSGAERAAGFDRITVVGVRQTKKDGAGEAAFATLLQNHHYTDGLAFVPQGAPTNNTSDASSAFSQKDPDYATSLGVERGAPLTSDSTADGPLTAAMLGLATSAFDHVEYADGHGRLNGRDMLLALWPATLGYFLEQMMDPVFNPVRQDEARSFALSNGAPRGLLPALRVGKTPYGVLPVTSLAAYPSPDAGTLRLDNPEAALAQFVKQLLPAWRTSIDGVPRVGGTSDPDQDLARVLGMDASSIDFRARQVLGDQTVWNLFQLLAFGGGSEEWWLEHEVRGGALLNSLGLGGWSPRVLRTSLARDSYPVPYPNVQDGPLSETDALKNDATVGAVTMNYIGWLQTATLADIWAENYPGPKPNSLLYRILRQSVLREYVTIAGKAQIAAGTLAPTALREQEMVNVAHATRTVTPREIVERPVAAGSTVSWAEFIHALGPTPEPQYARFADLRDSLGRLAKLPTAELDRLMTETLDACSHRVDVWASAIANSILQRRRAGQQDQSPRLHLGAYGWVEYVRAAPAPTPISRADAALVTRLDRDRQQRIGNAARTLRSVVQPPADSGGYIHAPSMMQAAAGAVLRSGWLSHRNSPDEPVLEVDLSSERVRRALWLLDGIRQGQSLGALTGYIFEEGMHEAGLDTYVQPFRDAYPLIGDELTASTASGTQMPPPQVVDGVKLRAAWQAGTFTAGQYWGLGLPLPSPPANADQTAVLALLGDIDDRMDGLADMSLAESVFQIMRGNYGHAGGMLDAISRGDHPPDPDIVTTPRRGTDITHRLVLLLAGAPTSVAAWSGVPSRPRAVAEPWLNDWIASRLPDPAVVRCRVGWTAGVAAQSVIVSLADLGAGPLDVIAMADAADQPQRSELESRILYKAAPPTGSTALTITYDTAGLPPGSLGFPDVMFAVRTLRDLLGGARPLDPAAFSLPQDDPAKAGGTVDAAELKTRADSLLAQLGDDIRALQTAMGNVAAAPQPVLDALMACSFYGVTGSVPRPAAVAADLAAQGAVVLAELQKRQTAAGTTSASMTADNLLAVIAAVLGKSALVLPHFKAPDLAGLQSSFSQSSAMTAADPLAPGRWLLQLSHIRSAPMRLDLAMSATELLGAPHLSGLVLAQLPPAANDRWLGLPLDSAHPLRQGRVAIEAVASGDPAAAPVFAGLMLDEFLDRIPGTDTSAGVAFHFDEPDARAPQTLLLAVCPDGRKTWDVDLLREILKETLELAKIRGVDLDSLQEAGQILPALYFPFNIPEATPSVRFLEVGVADAVLRASLS